MVHPWLEYGGFSPSAGESFSRGLQQVVYPSRRVCDGWCTFLWTPPMDDTPFAKKKVSSRCCALCEASATGCVLFVDVSHGWCAHRERKSRIGGGSFQEIFNEYCAHCVRLYRVVLPLRTFLADVARSTPRPSSQPITQRQKWGRVDGRIDRKTQCLPAAVRDDAGL